jgi:hypothetical protein
VKEENKAWEAKLGEAEQKAQSAKNEVRNTYIMLRPEWEIGWAPNANNPKKKNLEKINLQSKINSSFLVEKDHPNESSTKGGIGQCHCHFGGTTNEDNRLGSNGAEFEAGNFTELA